MTSPTVTQQDSQPAGPEAVARLTARSANLDELSAVEDG